MTADEIIHGRYRLLESLGSGGMATVWRAHDERLKRDVALKCLKAPLSEDPAFLVRFFAEAQAVAGLPHPNVVRVLDFGDGGGSPFLVMEYLPGGSLADLTGTPLALERAAALVSGAARGAGAAHAAGLVHRDLKPPNILLDDTGTPKIGDFGIAVAEAQERFTATGTALGSPHYVSPEQASGRPVGPQSDVYALGVVLYELVAGVRPFEGDNATALAIAHVEQEPVPPSSHVSEIPAELDDIALRCLAKDPERRFADGNELGEALESFARTDATVPVATVAAASAAATEDADDEVEPSPGRRRVVTGTLLAAALAALLVFGAVVLAGRNIEDKAVADAKQGPSVNHSETELRSPRPEEEDSLEVTEAIASPSATPSESATPSATPSPEEEEPTRARSRNEDEPTPEPTTEPTTEPTAESTPTP